MALLLAVLLAGASSARAQGLDSVDDYNCDFWDGTKKKPGGQYKVDRKALTATGKGIKGKAWVIVSPLSHEIFSKDGKLKVTINRVTGTAARWEDSEPIWLHGQCTKK